MSGVVSNSTSTAQPVPAVAANAGIGLAILTGMDKAVEPQLLLLYPDWLTGLTTRF